MGRRKKTMAGKTTYAEAAAALWREDEQVRAKFGAVDRLFDALGVARYPSATAAWYAEVTACADHFDISSAAAVRKIAGKKPELHVLYLAELSGGARTAKSSPGPAQTRFEAEVEMRIKRDEITRGTAIRAITQERPDLHDAFMAEIGG
jgi:hypothetical protein